MSSDSNHAYRTQIARLVGAMAMSDRETEADGDLAGDCQSWQVRFFVAGNIQKRHEKLELQLALLRDVFENFDFLIRDYVKSFPLSAFDTGMSDGERMLRWLIESRGLSAVQQDYVQCQLARFTIERLARQHREAHLQFQGRRAQAQGSQVSEDFGADPEILLNPIRTWSNFVTRALLDDEIEAPANVLFFAESSAVRTAFLEMEGQVLLNELADYAPCRLSSWMAITADPCREGIVEFCRDLSELGLLVIED